MGHLLRQYSYKMFNCKQPINRDATRVFNLNMLKLLSQYVFIPRGDTVLFNKDFSLFIKLITNLAESGVLAAVIINILHENSDTIYYFVHIIETIVNCFDAHVHQFQAGYRFGHCNFPFLKIRYSAYFCIAARSFHVLVLG